MSTNLVATALAKQEAINERGLQSFLEVGDALLAIRSDRLYLQTHTTFAEYCEDRWGFSDSRARRLVIAAKAVNTVTAGGLEAPSSERVARELAKVPEPKRKEVWRETLKQTGGKPTAEAVRKVVAPPTAQPEPTVPVGTVDPEPDSAPVPEPKAEPSDIERSERQLSDALDERVPGWRGDIDRAKARTRWSRAASAAADIPLMDPEIVAAVLTDDEINLARAVIGECVRWMARLDEALKPALRVMDGGQK